MDQGIPGVFVLFFIAAIVLTIGGTAWRVSTARRIARAAGMNEDDAATATLLTPNGLDATYLAASLRQGNTAYPDVPSARAAEDDDATASDIPAGPPSAATRLRELQDLLNQGLVTKAAFDQRRERILAEF